MSTPRIVVLTTGGTISSTASTPLPTGTSSGIRPALRGHDLLRALPADHPVVHALSDAVIEVVDIYQKDSSQLQPADVDAVTAAVVAALRNGASGIVVVHGTDTLESMALWLQMVCPLGDYRCPLAVTGASFPADSVNPDGPQNLADALHFVLRDDSAAAVHVVFAGRVLPAWGVVKIATDQQEAFASVSPEIGLQMPVLPTVTLPLRPTPLLAADTPLVRIVTSDFGDDGSLLRFAATPSPDNPVRAVVVEALGSGNLPVAAARTLCQLRAAHPEVAVVVTTRVPLGKVEAVYGCPGGGADLAAAQIPLCPYLRAPQCRMVVLALLQAGYAAAEIEQVFRAAAQCTNVHSSVRR
ncbi:asparaginase [Lawsonella clevelandensis]|uniref:asparaginase n=1 Tax=Lawsonella clevelandensis TaxID=1528099 RepID=UPI0023EFBE1F|nr:asparaginase domain-containing protein [Lawsonella clevelandensis]